MNVYLYDHWVFSQYFYFRIAVNEGDAVFVSTPPFAEYTPNTLSTYLYRRLFYEEIVRKAVSKLE